MPRDDNRALDSSSPLEAIRGFQLNLLAVPILMALGMPVPAHANNIPISSWCNSVWATGAGICSNPFNLNETSGMEGVKMNFFGSPDASNLDIGFKNLSYYSSYTFKGKSHGLSGNNGFAGDSWSGSSGTPHDTPNVENQGWPGGDTPPPGNPPGQNNIIHSDFVSNFSDLNQDPIDPAPVPEPRYAPLAVLITGLLLLGCRNAKRLRVGHSLHQ